MDPQFVAEVMAAVGIAVAIIRYWKAILAVVAIVVLTLTAIGAMTVMQNWPIR